MKNSLAKLIQIILIIASCFLFVNEGNAQPNVESRPNSLVLILGGANHTQGFPDPRIQQFYTAAAIDAAQKLASAFSAAKVKNSKFILDSRTPDYQKLVGVNLSMCDCRFIAQVQVGKNVR